MAVRGCTAVFHVAADYRLWVAEPGAMYRTNVAGSVNVLEAAAAAGVERMVYTSSVAVLGLNSRSQPGRRGNAGHDRRDDRSVQAVEILGGGGRSRRAAELAFPVVVVNPSTPIGPGDVKPTPTGRIILDAAAGRMPAFVDTGLNLVHVDDVARGHLVPR